MWETDIVKIVICAVFFSLAGCDSQQTDAVSKINTVKIVDIQPPVSEPLKIGQRVDIKVKLAYELESKAASVTFVVLRSEGFGNKSLANTFVIVQRGKGVQVLSGELIVPDTRMLNVRIQLTPQQRNDSAPVVIRSYKVTQ